MGTGERRHPRWVEDERRRLIDESCDRYEAEWRALQAPRIEDYLVGVEGEMRTALWLEIVMLDLELRRGNQEEPTLADYQESCPDGVILLDPSTADLGPIVERTQEAIKRGVGHGLTRGVGLPADLAKRARAVKPCDPITELLEPTEGVPGEPTGPISPPDTVGPTEEDLDLAARPDGLAMARPGCTMGDYVLLEKLGQGGMGVVFKAWQKGLNRDVALKMIKAGMLADHQEVRLFQFEAEAVAALDHPHIVPILDSGEHQGVLYYSMKLIDGRNLADDLRRFRDQPMAIARLMVGIAEAIHHAHQRGVLHRDLKPSNILVDERDAPHVIDFGLARRLEEGAVAESMLDSQPMGTPGYMSPEQARGHRHEITTASDVYGLGTILYTLLTGCPPFSGSSTLEVLRQVSDQDLSPPHARNSRVNRDLETVCLKCLRKEPRDRYASARDLADDLNRWIEGRPIVVRPASRVERAVKWVRRRPEIAALSAAVVLASILGLAGLVWGWLAALDARDEALKSEDFARHLAYAAKLNLAQRDWHDANTAPIRRHLDETSPPPGKTDLRGFDWYYLDRLCHTPDAALAGHEDVVWSVAYSPGGRRVASASWDGTVRLWDVATGQAVRTLRAGKPVNAVVFLPDGGRLVSAGSDRVATLWDVATGQPIRSFQGHTQTIENLAIAPDGMILAAASWDATVKLWDVATGRVLRTLDEPHADAVADIAFSSDGKSLISAGGVESTIRIWDVATGRRVRTLKDDRMESHISLAVSPDGKTLAATARHGTILLWNADGSVDHILRDHHNPDSFRNLAFSPDGKTLAALATSRQAINLWDLTTDSLLRTIKGHTRKIKALAFSPDGVHLASAGFDPTVLLWDATRDQESRTLRAKGEVEGVALSPDGSYLAAGGLDRTVTLWDVVTGQPGRTFQGHTGRIQSVAISPEGRRAASAGDDKSVRIWDVATGQPIHVLNGHTNAVCEVAFSPDGRTLATASNDRTVMLWDVEAGREIQALKGHIAAVKAVAFSPDGKTLVSAGRDGFALFWEVASGRQLRAIKAHSDPDGVQAIALSKDGRWLASGNSKPSIKVWDVATGREVHALTGHGMGINKLIFSHDSRRLISASDDGTVRIWDPVFGQEILVLRGHAGAVSDVAISPDGTRVVSASSDRTVKLWEANAGPRSPKDQ